MRTQIVVLLTTTLVSATASAADVAVVHHEVNLEAGAGEAFAAVCGQAYSAAGAAAPGTPRPPEGATETLELTLIGLGRHQGGRILVAATLKDGAGATQHHAQLEAESLEEAPVVCERLARALVTRDTPEAVRSRRSITRAEARASRAAVRLGTEKVLGVQARVLAPFAVGYTTSPALSLGFDGRFERDWYFIEASAGFIIPASSMGSGSSSQLSVNGIFVSAGAAFYLSQSDIAPYLGLGIEPRLSLFSGLSVGLAPYAQLGLMLFRQSSTRLYAELRVAQNVLPVRASYSAQESYPTELGVGLGVGF